MSEEDEFDYEYQTVCELYGEHRGERLVYEDEEECQYECTECGAEWFEEQEQYDEPGTEGHKGE